jgi:nucleotide-binding universal stress UspA family protein
MSVSSVLVAVRGEPSDDEAVRLACELIGSSKGSLYILYVIEVERGLPLDAEIAPSTARGEEILKRVEAVAKSFKCKTEAELVQARQAGCAVVQEAVDKAVDAIVVGVPYMQRFGFFSLGDTIPYVLKNAPCRVIISRGSVPQPQTNGRNSVIGD